VNSPAQMLNIRKAEEKDIPAIYQLLEHYAKQQIVLSRNQEDIKYYLANFVVAESTSGILGCAAVRDFGNELLEVRSLAVTPEMVGKGTGKAMVQEIIRLLKEQRSRFRLFALTYQTKFFMNLGFHRVDKHMFPEKIWSDCVKCPKKDRCDEDALLFEYNSGHTATN